MGVEDLSLIVPHQANQRILDAVEQRVGIPVYSNIRHLGNTSSTTIPLALDDIWASTPEGRQVGLCAFGGGFTFGAAILQALKVANEAGSDDLHTPTDEQTGIVTEGRLLASHSVL
jgi:3-oxoacyl-[acyl-carrier-protein] synthase III